MNRDNQPSEKGIYEMRVRGVLDAKWSDWFNGLTITQINQSNTLLMGTMEDQAALHGILAKIRDLGLDLLLVKKVGIFDSINTTNVNKPYSINKKDE